jgi:hypothetical protein
MSPFIYLANPFKRFGWQKFKELSDSDRQEINSRLNLLEGRYNSSRNIAIDILRLYLQTVITMVVVPLIFKTNLHEIFGDGVVNIYYSWIGFLISIMFGFLSYFLIFEGNYHLAHFYTFTYLSPFYSTDESVQKQLKRELGKNQIKSHIFLELSHILGIGAMLCFCAAIFFIVRAAILLIN